MFATRRPAPWPAPTLALVIGIAFAGCRSPAPVERDSTALLQTDALTYTLERDEVGYRTRIPWVFRNDTGGPVVLPNCRGDVRPRLEKLRDGRWYFAWEPFQEPCESPPLVIEAGATWADTLVVRGAPPGSNVLPAFVFPEVEGVYRLVWVQAYEAWTPADPESAVLLPLDQRRSNAFVLTR